jgi:NAD(P)-dependent dehydrogenase (short-subunit alcohol dehydrogenase family)
LPEPTQFNNQIRANFASFPGGGTAVVFGAGGGIGRALTNALSANDSFPTVRSYGRSTEIPIDFEDETSIARAVADAATTGDLRLVIDATGLLHEDDLGPEKTFKTLDPAWLARNFLVNAIGPAMLMKHILPLLPRTGKSVFATLSARVGSIGDNRLGGWYGYRASKAALNQLVKTASIELSRKCPQAACLAIHPGTVETNLSARFLRDRKHVHQPDDAASRILRTLDQLDHRNTGGFFDCDGQTIVW